jgi:uncharacterized protein (UPF0210 family)
MVDQTRRKFLGTLASAALLPAEGLRAVRAHAPERASARPFRVRTITAGIDVRTFEDLETVEASIALLERGRVLFEDEGYEVETLRLSTPPVVAGLSEAARDAVLPQLQALDRLLESKKVMLGLGPVLLSDRADAALPPWAGELVRTTRQLSFSVVIASPDGGAQPEAAAVAARTMAAIAGATPGGAGNFRFAAAANVPAGTPFFPVSYHRGPDALAIGLESASLVEAAFAGARNAREATNELRNRLDEALAPVERVASAFAEREGRVYLGIDPSPAPAKDRSIGAAIEALTQAPFGRPSTLEACAAATAALKSLRAKTCGYAGLMLPVLEDPGLAQRATEGRFGIRELLLYSSVCGTGLDTVPIPGETPVATVAKILLDVAALADRLGKALSARLFLVPGKKAGEMARFDDPYLTDCAVMPVD